MHISNNFQQNFTSTWQYNTHKKMNKPNRMLCIYCLIFTRNYNPHHTVSVRFLLKISKSIVIITQKLPSSYLIFANISFFLVLFKTAPVMHHVHCYEEGKKVFYVIEIQLWENENGRDCLMSTYRGGHTRLWQLNETILTRTSWVKFQAGV